MISTRIQVIGHYMPIIELIFLSFTFVTLSLRLASRIVVSRKQPGWEDSFACVAFAMAMGLSLTHLVGCNWTHGTTWLNTRDPKAAMYVDENRLWTLEYVQDWLFSVGELFTKISILLFYKEFCEGRKSGMRTVINCSMSFFVMWSTALAAALTVLCLSHKAQVDTEESLKTKEAIGIALMVMQSLSLLSDLIVFLVPIPLVWKIKATVTKKVGIIALMGPGLLVCFVALIRFHLIYVLFFTEDDLTWYCYASYLSLSLKLDLLIACACLPFCKPILQYLHKEFISRENDSNNNSRPPRSPFPVLPRGPYTNPGAPPKLPVTGTSGGEKEFWQVRHIRSESDVSSEATLLDNPDATPMTASQIKLATVRVSHGAPTSLTSKASSESSGEMFVEICLDESWV